uniref:Uncharacterized protein n=1 Tax=Anopheles quadriannulatus TaxID=34691 RepID=A0A182X8Q8_ANOQN
MAAVSTPTGIISHFVNLQVVVPEAFILGSGELHVDMGSTINLVCIIEKHENNVVDRFIFLTDSKRAITSVKFKLAGTIQSLSALRPVLHDQKGRAVKWHVQQQQQQQLEE